MARATRRPFHPKRTSVCLRQHEALLRAGTIITHDQVDEESDDGVRDENRARPSLRERFSSTDDEASAYRYELDE
jgi:hypothetical protein